MFGGAGWVVGGSEVVRCTRHWRVATWLTLTLLAIGCGNDRPAPTPALGGSSSSELPGLFEECTPGQACEAGTECITVGGRSRCEHLCQSDADCDFTLKVPVEEVTAVCGTLTAEVKACTTPCTGLFEDAYACVDGHPVYCTALDETSCAVCGCPDNLRCEHDVGCQPKRGLDAECLEDGDCISNNCDFYAHLCRVAVGSPCTATNCERCVASRNGTFCSRTCDWDEQCNGAGCAFKECVPLCAGPVDARCPGECDFHYHPGGGSPDIYACDCAPLACKVLAPAPEVGDQCDEDSDCGTEGVCLLRHPPEYGACSRHCSATNPCSAGRSCVDVPCAQGETDTCGALCLNDCAEAEPRCVAGNCRPLQTIDARSVEVCDYRKPAGARCEAHNDCQSGLCTKAACAPAP